LRPADASSAVATPEYPCVLITNETKSTLLPPSDIDGAAPDGNKKYVLNPTVAIPDDGWVNTIECESPIVPPVQVIVVIPAANVMSWCCAVPRLRITVVFAVGDDAVAGESLGMIESVKASSDFYSPISGEVIEVNEELEASPELVNQNAYENGLIAKIKISDKAEFDELLDEDDYEALCVEEEH
jgi:hypothetical protein